MRHPPFVSDGQIFFRLSFRLRCGTVVGFVYIRQVFLLRAQTALARTVESASRAHWLIDRPFDANLDRLRAPSAPGGVAPSTPRQTTLILVFFFLLSSCIGHVPQLNSISHLRDNAFLVVALKRPDLFAFFGQIVRPSRTKKEKRKHRYFFCWNLEF